MSSIEAPESIQAVLSKAALEIGWSDGVTVAVSFRDLRGACPCANCVDEMTGIRKFHPTDARPEIAPAKLELTGNYAIRIYWNDGHHTGLFTWNYLRKICDEISISR